MIQSSACFVLIGFLLLFDYSFPVNTEKVQFVNQLFLTPITFWL